VCIYEIGSTGWCEILYATSLVTIVITVIDNITFSRRRHAISIGTLKLISCATLNRKNEIFSVCNFKPKHNINPNINNANTNSNSYMQSPHCILWSLLRYQSIGLLHFVPELLPPLTVFAFRLHKYVNTCSKIHNFPTSSLLV
jgi:hypothetical protein